MHGKVFHSLVEKQSPPSGTMSHSHCDIPVVFGAALVEEHWETDVGKASHCCFLS